MPYHFNTAEDRQEMLKAIGVGSIDDLFAGIPPSLRLQRPLDIPPALSELELTQHMTALARRNADATDALCFLGAGSYDHFIPAVVDAMASRGEFYTSYTPYQPEVSQGNLQAMFEYQTLICQLTGMDVSNASLYDGGSALTEAALMALSVAKGRGNVVVADSVHPEYRQILATYLRNIDADLVTIPCPDGILHSTVLAEQVDSRTACVIVQHPNFFGCPEDLGQITTLTHQAGASLVVSVDPISLGLLKRPGDYGADIVVAEGQSLGNPMSYGGPYLGIMACRERFLRRMPGRIAGQTADHHGQTCWVLTMQTREQHIRRDKATSNICTNQGLFALRASIYLSLLGPQGMREVATLSMQKAHYAAGAIDGLDRFSLAWRHPFFKEFTVRDHQGEVAALLKEAEGEGILAGVPLGTWYPEFDDCFLVSVTEQRTRAEIDRLTAYLAKAKSTETLSHA